MTSKYIAGQVFQTVAGVPGTMDAAMLPGTERTCHVRSGISFVMKYQSSTNGSCSATAMGPSSRMKVSAPRAELRVAAHVFVADVLSADEGDSAVRDDELAVIAEVEAEAFPAFAIRHEGL